MGKKRILVTDNLQQEGVNAIKRYPDLEVDVMATMSEEEMIKIIGRYNAVIIRSASKITKAIIEAGTNLEVIGRAGVGTDNIDKTTATQKGILVMNAPEGNSVSTAEQTLALMLSLARKITWAHQATSQGVWEKKKFSGTQLKGKTLGIFGLGRIGKEVAIRAKAFGMTVMGNDPYFSKEQAEVLGIDLFDRSTILENADIITVHTPLTDETRNLINKETISRLKDGVMLINCARGGIYNEADVAEALKSGKISGAAFDVFSKEPVTEDNPLLNAPNCILTPHLGASTKEAQIAVALEMGDVIGDFLTNGTIRNAVNFPSVPMDILKESKDYLQLAQRMGLMVTCFLEGHIKEVKLIQYGNIPERANPLLGRAALTGVLKPYVAEDTTMINSLTLAQDRGINLISYIGSQVKDYTDSLELEVKTDISKYTVKGTVYANRSKRIVELNGYSIDMIPEGRFIVFTNQDVPGVIGSVGMALANNQINIANMFVGRKEKGSNAISLVLVDDQVDANILEALKATGKIINPKVIDFTSM